MLWFKASNDIYNCSSSGVGRRFCKAAILWSCLGTRLINSIARFESFKLLQNHPYVISLRFCLSNPLHNNPNFRYTFLWCFAFTACSIVVSMWYCFTDGSKSKTGEVGAGWLDRDSWKEIRRGERKVKGYGEGRAIRWNRKALHTFTQCRTGKGNLGKWKNQLDPWVDASCRHCGEETETGFHAGMVCARGD